MKVSSYVCVSCNGKIPENKLRCPHCGRWNSGGVIADSDFDSVLLSKVERGDHERIKTGPWDTAFGGGIVPTTVTLLGGAPGAGKSTLLLQIADKFPGEPCYIAAEEALAEIAIRADRLGIKKDIRLVPALNGANMAGVLERFKPSLVMIDSLQGLVGRDDDLQEEVCKISKVLAVKLGCPVILVSHVNKQEALAGKMTLQHTVDVTLLFFPEGNERILFATKSRVGPAFIECVFRMTSEGLVFVEKRDGKLE